jgi:hypothetical protein
MEIILYSISPKKQDLGNPAHKVQDLENPSHKVQDLENPVHKEPLAKEGARGNLGSFANK